MTFDGVVGFQDAQRAHAARPHEAAEDDVVGVVGLLAAGWRRDHVWLYQWVTRLFTPLYQSDSRFLPAIRDRVLAPLSRHWPARGVQAQLMSGLFGFPLAPLGLTLPDYAGLSASLTSLAASGELQS